MTQVMQNQSQEVRPAFVVRPIEGEFEKEVVKYQKDSAGKPERVVTKRKFTNGFMVYFPRGHSIFVETEAELERLGFTKDSPLVDMNSGEIVGSLGIPLSLVNDKSSAKSSK